MFWNIGSDAWATALTQTGMGQPWAGDWIADIGGAIIRSG